MGACVTGSHPGPVDRGPCMHNETEQYLGWVRQRLGPQYFAHHLLTQFASLELPGLFLWVQLFPTLIEIRFDLN